MLFPDSPHNVFAWPSDTIKFGLKGIKDFILETFGALVFVIFQGEKVSLLSCKLFTRRHLETREELVTNVTVEHIHLLKILVMVLGPGLLDHLNGLDTENIVKCINTVSEGCYNSELLLLDTPRGCCLRAA